MCASYYKERRCSLFHINMITRIKVTLEFLLFLQNRQFVKYPWLRNGCLNCCRESRDSNPWLYQHLSTQTGLGPDSGTYTCKWEAVVGTTRTSSPTHYQEQQILVFPIKHTHGAFMNTSSVTYEQYV